MSLSIGIVIPTKNRKGGLLKAVQSALKQVRMPYEIIIVDQSTTDRLAGLLNKEFLNYPDVKFKYLYRPDIKGLTSAKNAAIEVAKSDIIFFMDDDIILDRNFIEVLYGIYDKYPEIDGVGGIVTVPSNKTSFLRRNIAVLFQIGPFRDNRALLQAGYFLNREIAPTWLLSGGLSSLRREVFESVLFNERLTGASPIEDMDFYLRCKGRFHFAIATKAKALHNISVINRGCLQKAYKTKCLGFFYIYQKYIKKNFFNTLSFLWRVCGLTVDAAVVSIIKNSPEPLKGLIDGFKKALKLTKDQR